MIPIMYSKNLSDFSETETSDKSIPVVISVVPNFVQILEGLVLRFLFLVKT